MSALSLITAAVKNFQPTTSVLAGGAASILVTAIGAVLVAVGVAIPPIGILGLTAATPLTMTMVNQIHNLRDVGETSTLRLSHLMQKLID
jgi:hypothetical protein